MDKSKMEQLFEVNSYWWILLKNNCFVYAKTNNKWIPFEGGAQIPFNFMLLSNTWMGTGTYGYIENIKKLLDNMPKGDRVQANWVVSCLQKK